MMRTSAHDDSCDRFPELLLMSELNCRVGTVVVVLLCSGKKVELVNKTLRLNQWWTYLDIERSFSRRDHERIKYYSASLISTYILCTGMSVESDLHTYYLTVPAATIQYYDIW